MKKILILFFLLIFFVSQMRLIYAVSLDEVTKELEDLKKTFSEIDSANKTNETTLSNINKQLQGIKVKVNQLESAIDQKEKEVAQGEKVFDYQKELLNARAKSYYKNIGKNSLTLVQLLLSDNLSVSLRNFFYGKTLVDEDRRTIVKIVMYIKGIEEKKKELETEQIQLTALKADVEKQSNFLAGEVAKTKQYLGELQSKIASLTAQQQAIIAARQAGLNLPRSAGVALGGCVDDRNIDPGFSPAFAFYTYGSVHRVGMNQFGAYGRAKAGQNYETILNAYYNNVKLECKTFQSNNNIKVQGYSEMNIYDYLKGIGEMPSSWGDSGGYEALKAQVVAAASFAYAYTGGGGGEICTSQDCQVYTGSNKGGKWEEAVNDIKNKCGDNVQVMVSNDTGEVIKAWYASTHGGYAWTSGEIWGGQKPWTKHFQDTSSNAGNFSELNERAWDKESPWFYCDWGSRPEYNKTAWLKSDEVADIANAILLVRADSSTSSHVGQPDKPTGDTWDQNRLKQELRNRNVTPFNSVSSVSINADMGYGKTNGITINGDVGSVNFDGKEFKDFFNVRAPANIQIVGPLYNVEKR